MKRPAGLSACTAASQGMGGLVGPSEGEAGEHGGQPGLVAGIYVATKADVLAPNNLARL